jgi:hypothetical protein
MPCSHDAGGENGLQMWKIIAAVLKFSCELLIRNDFWFLSWIFG